MTGNAKLAIGVGGALALLWLLSRNAGAAVVAGGASACSPPNFWKTVGPDSNAYDIATAKKYGDGSGYCARHGTVLDGGTDGPATAVGAAVAAVSGAVNNGYAAIVGFFNGAPSSPASGPVTDPSQVSDAGGGNDPQWTSMGDV